MQGQARMRGQHRSPAELFTPSGMEGFGMQVPCTLETSALPWPWQPQPRQKSCPRSAGVVFAAEELPPPAPGCARPRRAVPGCECQGWAGFCNGTRGLSCVCLPVWDRVSPPRSPGCIMPEQREEQCPASISPWPEAAALQGECGARGQARWGTGWQWEGRGDSRELGGFLTCMKGAGVRGTPRHWREGLRPGAGGFRG